MWLLSKTVQSYNTYSSVFFPGPDASQVVDECDTAMSNHGEELDDNYEAVHSQEQELKRLWVNLILLKLPKLE